MSTTAFPASPVTATRQILVVDDDVAAARAMRSVLNGAGYDAILCHAGSDAISCAGRIKLAAAVIDVHLPDVSGLILTQQLRGLFGPAIPIIVISGDTSMETLNSLKHVGASYFFSKPTNVTHLLERLKECVV